MRHLHAGARGWHAVAVMASVVLSVTASNPIAAQVADGPVLAANRHGVVSYHTVRIGSLDVFYREAGPKDAPCVLLLHGFPTSSHMYRNLIPALADRYHVIAPDYPGFGRSSMPSRETFAYTFANLTDVVDKFTRALGVDRYTLYVMDYGAPVGYRLALKHPERVEALIVQNGNAYEEGLREFWAPLKRYWSSGSVADRDSLRTSFTLAASRWQYMHGVRDTALISPDNWVVDQYYLNRPGNHEIQLDLFYDYRTNVQLYPAFQAYFRRYQPPTLVVWGKNDVIFPWQGAEPYKRDLKTLEYHLLDTGHFALEEDGEEITRAIRGFLGKHVRGVARANAGEP
jgi:pimeloyl-ACP methyl ester carboxylesterase